MGAAVHPDTGVGVAPELDPRGHPDAVATLAGQSGVRATRRRIR